MSFYSGRHTARHRIICKTFSPRPPPPSQTLLFRFCSSSSFSLDFPPGFLPQIPLHLLPFSPTYTRRFRPRLITSSCVLFPWPQTGQLYLLKSRFNSSLIKPSMQSCLYKLSDL